MSSLNAYPFALNNDYLFEAYVISIFPEASSAHIKTIFSNQTMAVFTHTTENRKYNASEIVEKNTQCMMPQDIQHTCICSDVKSMEQTDRVNANGFKLRLANLS